MLLALVGLICCQGSRHVHVSSTNPTRINHDFNIFWTFYSTSCAGLCFVLLLFKDSRVIHGSYLRHPLVEKVCELHLNFSSLIDGYVSLLREKRNKFKVISTAN